MSQSQPLTPTSPHQHSFLSAFSSLEVLASDRIVYDSVNALGLKYLQAQMPAPFLKFKDEGYVYPALTDSLSLFDIFEEPSKLVENDWRESAIKEDFDGLSLPLEMTTEKADGLGLPIVGPFDQLISYLLNYLGELLANRNDLQALATGWKGIEVDNALTEVRIPKIHSSLPFRGHALLAIWTHQSLVRKWPPLKASLHQGISQLEDILNQTEKPKQKPDSAFMSLPLDEIRSDLQTTEVLSRATAQLALIKTLKTLIESQQGDEETHLFSLRDLMERDLEGIDRSSWVFVSNGEFFSKLPEDLPAGGLLAPKVKPLQKMHRVPRTFDQIFPTPQKLMKGDWVETYVRFDSWRYKVEVSSDNEATRIIQCLRECLDNLVVNRWTVKALGEAMKAIVPVQGIPGESFTIFRDRTPFAPLFLMAKKVHLRLVTEWTTLRLDADRVTKSLKIMIQDRRAPKADGIEESEAEKEAIKKEISLFEAERAYIEALLASIERQHVSETQFLGNLAVELCKDVHQGWSVPFLEPVLDGIDTVVRAVAESGFISSSGKSWTTADYLRSRYGSTEGTLTIPPFPKISILDEA